MKKIFLNLLVISLLTFCSTSEKINNKIDKKRNPEIDLGYKLLNQKKNVEAENIFLKLTNLEPNNLYSHIGLDVSLNNQRKYSDADKIRLKILNIWNRDFKDDFIKQGSPIRSRTWLRLMFESNHHKIQASEYFTPEKVNLKGVNLISTYKFVVQGKLNPNVFRIYKFMLNENTKKYILAEILEKEFLEIKSYENNIKPVNQVGEDLIGTLNQETQNYMSKYTQKPLVVLLERNPWLMVYGSDSPTFALYEDGNLIYLDDKAGYKSVILTKNEMEQLLKNGENLNLDENYLIANATDQPMNSFYIWKKGFLEFTHIYGNLNGSQSKELPIRFTEFYRKIKAFKKPKPEKWLPEKIEVIVWDYSYSPDVPVKWPSNWPDMDSPGNIKGEKYSKIYLDKKFFNDFIKLLSSLKEKQAIEIKGKKYTASYRLAFPSEEIWMQFVPSGPYNEADIIGE